jgi:nucleoside-diphosphate-sugar epimerase
MKVLVTGGAGFLSRSLIPLLKATGHHVVTTDRRGSVDYCGDLTDPAFVATLPEVDTVVHTAAVQYVDPKTIPLFGRRTFFQHNNVEATRLLVERYRNPSSHFVNIATSMIYQQAGQAICTVNSPMSDEGWYARSKVAAKALVEARPGVNSTVVPCIIAGEGRSGLFASLLKGMQRWGVVLLPGRGDHPVHLVHVEDCASLVAHVVETRSAGMFNAASRDALSIRDWIKDIEQEFGLKPVRVIRLPLAPVYALSALLGFIPVPKERLLMLRYPHVLDISEGLRIGWSPRWTNREIVRETVRALHRDARIAG